MHSLPAIERVENAKNRNVFRRERFCGFLNPKPPTTVLFKLILSRMLDQA